jgi:YNFM family putative membrane transporter
VTSAYIEKGTAEFRRTNLALFGAGFSTFALLYCVQPLMPEFSREFHASAAESSLTISLTTGLLAFSMLVAGSISEAWGRKPIMVVSLFASATLTIMAAAVVRSWHGLLTLRALEGVAFAGLPAIAMAYLSEEMGRGAIGLGMGLYISGSGLGGMSGRLLTGWLTDLVSWRFAIGTIGVLGLIAAFIFWRSLPPSRHFHARPLDTRGLLASFTSHLRDLGLLALFTEGFLLMGSFVTIYNYISYRLLAPPYNLSQTGVGLIFVVYLVGVASSAVVGDLAGRRGRRKVLWATLMLMLAGVCLTFLSSLVAIIVGMAVMTIGFFGGHSVASSWVGLRAQHNKAQASSLYLFFYYLGSSLVGWSGGLFYAAARWDGVAGFIALLLTVAFLISLRLTAVQPITPHVPVGTPP